MSKTMHGNFFEDFFPGQKLTHAIPRTITEGDRALLTALYLNPFAISSSDAFARACGLPGSPLDPVAVFHIVFGKSVPDISRNAIANLGYAECRFLRLVYPGDTLRAVSEILGVRQNASGKTGVVYVRTTGLDQEDRPVLEYCRWVMVRKRAPGTDPPEPSVPTLADRVDPVELVVPAGLTTREYDPVLAGGPYLWGDYHPGEQLDHVDGVTVEEAEHQLATRLWQNNARVHFDRQLAEAGQFRQRIVYGGHVISLARMLSFNGLPNAQLVAAINGGTHAAPCFAGDTVHAWSEILEAAETPHPEFGALRVRTICCKNRPATDFPAREADGNVAEGVILDLDWWLLLPR